MTATHPDAARPVPATTLGRLLPLLRATSGAVEDTVSPLDGRPVASIPQSSAEDVDAAFARARRAQPTWAALGASGRGRHLLAFHDLLLAHQSELADIIVVESGKARRDAVEEILHLAMTARYYGRNAAALLRPQRRRGVVPLLTRVDVLHHPKGVVSVISPWNYPLTMAMADGVAALAAGNTVVAKPDSRTVLSALAGLDLLRRAGVPDDVWQVVAGPGPVVGTALAERGDHVCVTGSVATGRTVAAIAGRRLVGASLELGGKNPMVVLADADLDAAVAGALRGCFANAGQLCVSVERLYVDRAVYGAFRARFVAAVRRLDLSVGTGWAGEVGTLTSAGQLERVSAHVADARERRATVLTGGRARPDLAPWAYEPTVLEGVTPDMACHHEETFGPVVALYPFDTEDEAVALANDSAYGLNASVWSRDHARARSLASRIRTGTVNVNEPLAASFGSLGAPMGGRGQSGLGRRQGPEGLVRFTEVQVVATQRLVGLGKPARLTHEQFAALLTRSQAVMRALGL